MRKWKQAIIIMISLQALTSCKTVDVEAVEEIKINPPQITDVDGNTKVQIIDNTDIVFMRLSTWKEIVRFITFYAPEQEEQSEKQIIKNAIISKEDFQQLLN